MSSSEVSTKEIVIPSFGESIREVRLARLIIPTNTKVSQDQEIAEIETDKLSQTLYAPSEGILIWNIREGETVPIGALVARIETVGSSLKHETAPVSDSVFTFSLEPQEEAPDILIKEQKDDATVLSDVKSATIPIQAKGSIEQKGFKRKPMSSVRRVIAQRLKEVKDTTAMLTTFNEVDMHRIIEIRETYKQQFMDRFQVKLGFMSFFVKAVVVALKQFPVVNSFIDGTDIVEPDSIDIGVAVSTEKGVVVPVIRNADILSYAEIEKEIQGAAERARSGKLRIEELQGGTFTITNGGVFGSLLSTPILNPPQSAILGMHAIQKRAVVVDDQIMIRPMMYLALSYDHRLLDGQDAVSFLVTIKKELEDPDRQLLGL